MNDGKRKTRKQVLAEQAQARERLLAAAKRNMGQRAQSVGGLTRGMWGTIVRCDILPDARHGWPRMYLQLLLDGHQITTNHEGREVELVSTMLTEPAPFVVEEFGDGQGEAWHPTTKPGSVRVRLVEMPAPRPGPFD